MDTAYHPRMAEKAKQKEKDPVNIVHQNAIFRELVHKEQRHQKLYTNYSVNPFKRSMLYIIIYNYNYIYIRMYLTNALLKYGRIFYHLLLPL